MMLAEKLLADSTRPRTADVLIIDDDDATLVTFQRLLRLEGFSVLCASTGAKGLELGADIDFDVVLVDLRLADMSGIELISALRKKSTASLVLMSAFLTVRAVIEAMKCGASMAVEKPLDVDDLMAVVQNVRGRPATAELGSVATDQWRNRLIRAPQSIVERWVSYVIKACDSANEDPIGDFKTLENWARRVGVSCSTLCESCRLLSIRPLDARDFVRILAALRSAITHRCAPEVLLDVSNRRVLRALSLKAGVDIASVSDASSLDRFFRAQQLIPPNSEALRLIRTFFSESANQPWCKRGAS